MISALLLATTLIVPPKGMGQVAQIPAARAGVLASHGITILERYRGIATTKWDGRWYKTPFYVAVSSLDRDEDPAYAGMIALSQEFNPPVRDLYETMCSRSGCRQFAYDRHMRVLEAHAIGLCHGARGWINKYTEGLLKYTVVQVFARANGKVYLASTGYDATNGDIFHSEKSLETLCPDGIAPPASLQMPSAVQAPEGFLAVDPSSSPEIGHEMDTSAVWLRLSPQTAALQWMILGQATNVDENITPEQDSDFMRQSLEPIYSPLKTLVSRAQSYCGVKDGWYRTFTGTSRTGYKFVFTTEYAYKGGESFALFYSHRIDEKENPAALASLRSFCPR